MDYAQAAVAVRRWDDAGKDPNTAPPSFAEFRSVLEAVLD